ncbi:hypothetical protein CEXT_201541 [Caerostris extrusa]|uniref:Uncharacterized protein n=1 Tax=Caerostris extrusa TaxID=172846 RepID=A0AAV4MV89_CAEEX|nr:hypothetical protein CEXT_201541 [Caerostris extrusa]
MIMDDHTYTREKEDAREVTAEGSLSPFQDQLPPESPKRSGRPVQSPLRCARCCKTFKMNFQMIKKN